PVAIGILASPPGPGFFAALQIDSARWPLRCLMPHPRAPRVVPRRVAARSWVARRRFCGSCGLFLAGYKKVAREHADTGTRRRTMCELLRRHGHSNAFQHGQVEKALLRNPCAAATRAPFAYFSGYSPHKSPRFSMEDRDERLFVISTEDF